MQEEIEKEIRSEGETKRVHGETQMQWTSIEEEREIGHVITVGSLAIWPETVRRGIKQE